MRWVPSVGTRALGELGIWEMDGHAEEWEKGWGCLCEAPEVLWSQVL